MPIVSRRRIQAMLDDLHQSGHDAQKINTLVDGLNEDSTRTVMANEAELIMLWALNKTSEIEIEPELKGSRRRPDALSRNLFPSSQALIEVQALSDDSFSGRESMERTANICCTFANRIVRQSENHLHFEFGQRSGYFQGKFFRNRLTDKKFALTEDTEREFEAWLRSDRARTHRIVAGDTDVTISYRERVFRESRVFSRMPPLAYDLERNPLFNAIKDKNKQLKSEDQNILRCVFLVDAGCKLLNDLEPFMRDQHQVSGEEIIWHALTKLSLDFVCVFSPKRGTDGGKPQWHVTYFDKRVAKPDGEYASLKRMAEILPRPRYEGYQARSLERQSAFSPDNNSEHVGVEMITGNGSTTMKIPAQILQQYLAGLIDFETFHARTHGHDTKNQFLYAYENGQRIESVNFEAMGLDEDDDRVEFCLRESPSASKFK